MSLKTPVCNTSYETLLDNTRLSEDERLRAKIAMMRGEYLAELLLSAKNTVHKWLHASASHAKSSQPLNSAG